jgi:D-amino-acid dehydrogenase
MHTLVIGSGVIGTTTAYYLARSGHQVTVVDRQAGAGLETSFANAGQVSPGYSSPWAAPGIPLKAIKWLLSKHSPLVISPRMDAAMLRFMFHMLRNCTAERYRVNKSRMLWLVEKVF